MPMPSASEAKKLYEKVNKEGSFDKLNDEGKKIYLQYRFDQGLLPLEKANEQGRAFFSKYIDTSKVYYSGKVATSKLGTYTKPEEDRQPTFDDAGNLINADKYGTRTEIASEGEYDRFAFMKPQKNIQQPFTPQPLRPSGRMLEDIEVDVRKPQPMKQQLPLQKNDRQNKVVVQQGKVAEPGLKRPDNPAAPALVNFANTASLGLLERNNPAIDKLREDSPIGSAAGSMAGYLVPFGAAKGALAKGTQSVGKRILTDMTVGAGIDTATELTRNKLTPDNALKNVAQGAGIGLIADVVLEGSGKLIQAIAKKYGKNMPEQVAQVIKQVHDIEAKPNKSQQEIDDYYGMIEYLDEVNRSDPKYIKAEARLNVPKAKEIKTLTKQIPQKPDAYLDEYLDSIGEYENLWNQQKTSMKPPKSDILNTKGVSGMDRPLKRVEDGRIQVLHKNTVNGRKLEITPDGQVILHGYASTDSDRRNLMNHFNFDVENYFSPLPENVYVRTSNNPDDFMYLKNGTHKGSTNHWKGYDEVGLSVAKKAYDPNAKYVYYVQGSKIATGSDGEPILDINTVKLVSKKPMSMAQYSKDYNQKLEKRIKELGISNKDYRDLFVDTKIVSEMPQTSGIEKKITPNSETPSGVFSLQPPKLEGKLQPLIVKGQVLKPNKPILSALDAKINKPYDAPKIPQNIKPLEPLEKSGNVNTLPIEQKSLIQPPIKPQNEAAVAKDIKPNNAAKTAKEAVSKAPTKKDISGFQAYTTDVYRNFETVFKEDYPAVKKDILDPFDNAKKAKTVEDRKLMADLKKNVVDKFNIQKGSKESALIQQYGEKRISYESLVDKVGKAKADNIVEADKWFRQQYEQLLEDVNKAREKVYPNNPDKIIPRRTNYYRHFQELSNDFKGLMNIFETPSQISPSLAGASEFTKPKSKFLSFAQKRGNGKFTDDAVGGFLEYINAATYAKHVDTQIPNFRALAADLAETTEQSKNMNNFIQYLTDFSNDLSGKTNPADRFVQKIIPGGRTTFKALNWLNSRVKANTVLGNLSSTLSQVANVPQGIAYVKNPAHLSKGAGNFMASLVGKGDAELYKKSGFLLERYADNIARQFDTKILDQPKKAAAWMLSALDEVGTKFIWSSTYQKALAEGIENPIKYADDVTRKLVGGRGIGESSLIQKSKLYQLVAPFTLEVANLWNVQKDFIKAKDFGGLAMLYLANFALNKGMEEVRGDGVVFDPIQAIYDALTEKDLSALEKAGRLGGEVLSNMPLGSTAASLYPEYGVNNEFVSLPTREKLFGRNDPTRYGSGLLVAKAIQDPLYKVLPPFAGGQAKKTIQAGQDLGLLPKLKKEEGKILPTLKKQDIPASYSNTRQGDRMRTTIEPTPASIAKGLAFGRGAIPEVKKYYESGKVPLGTKQTENIQKLIKKGYEPNKLFKSLNSIRGTNKKADIVAKLREYGYNSKQIAEIWEVFYK